MARVRRFIKGDASMGRIHPTEVDCSYSVFSAGGERYLQLNSYGSQTRAQPGTVSQTLQLDRESAVTLKALIEQAFGG